MEFELSSADVVLRGAVVLILGHTVGLACVWMVLEYTMVRCFDILAHREEVGSMVKLESGVARRLVSELE